MPSASDLNRYHSDTENFVRQLDDLLGASKAGGRAKPRLDPKAAQNRLQDLAKQIQGAAISNPDSEEVKILNELTRGLTDDRNYAKSLGTVRNKYDTFKRSRDDLFRESLAVEADIENKINLENKEIERARKTLEETGGKFKETAGTDKAYNELSSSFKQSIDRRKDRIKSLQEKLGKQGISLKEMKDVQQEIKQLTEQNKPAIEEFKKKGQALLEKAGQPAAKEAAPEQGAQAETEAEEEPEKATEEGAGKAEAEPAAAAPEVRTAPTAAAPILAQAPVRIPTPTTEGQTASTAAIDATQAAPAVAAAGAALAATATAGEVIRPQRIIQVGGETPTPTSPAAAPGIQIQPTPPAAAGATVPVEVSVPSAGAAGTAQVEIQASIPAAPSQAPSTVSAGVPVPAGAPAAQIQGTVTIQPAPGKLERAAQARGIPVSVTAETAAAPPQVAAIATAYQSQLNVVRGQTSLLREAASGNRPDLNPAQLASQIGSTRENIERLHEQLRAQAEFADTDSYKTLDRTIRQSSESLTEIQSTLGSGSFPTQKNIDVLQASTDQGSDAALGIQAAAFSAAAAAATAAAGGAGTRQPSAKPQQELERGRQLMEQRAGEAAEAGEEAPPARPNRPLPSRGPAPRPTPRMAPGTKIKPSTTLPASVSAAEPVAGGGPIEGPGGDTELTDESLNLGRDEQRRSVLDLGMRRPRGPYAQGEDVGAPYAGEEEFAEAQAGGGALITSEDYERQAKMAQQRQIETMEAAMPGAVPAAAGAGMLAGAIGGTTALAGTEEDWGEEGAPETEEEPPPEGQPTGRGGGPMDQAKQMLEDKLKEQTDKIKEEIKKKAEEQVKKLFQKTTEKAVTKGAGSGARVTLEGTEAVNTPDTVAISLAIMIVEMNLQLVLKYLLKGMEEIGIDAEKMAEETGGQGAGKAGGVMKSFLQQTLAEDFITIALDCGLICTTNPCCYFAFMLLMIVFVVIIGLDDDVQSLFKVWLGQ